MTSPALLYRSLNGFVLAEDFDSTPAYIVNLPAAVEVFAATVADAFIELALSVSYLARAILTSLDPDFDSLSECIQASQHLTQALTSVVRIVTAPILTLFAGPEAIRELYFAKELELLRATGSLQSRIIQMNYRFFKLTQKFEMLCQQNKALYQASEQNAEVAEELREQLGENEQYIEDLKRKNENLIEMSRKFYQQFKDDGELLEEALEDNARLKEELSENEGLLKEAEETFKHLSSENERLKSCLKSIRVNNHYSPNPRAPKEGVTPRQRRNRKTPQLVSKKLLFEQDENLPGIQVFG